jgi:hypothetical protein
MDSLDSNDLEQLSVSFNHTRGLIKIAWKPVGEPVHHKLLPIAK